MQKPNRTLLVWIRKSEVKFSVKRARILAEYWAKQPVSRGFGFLA